jgi:hypothetical protein
MANVKISDLPAVTVPLAGTEEIPVVQSGVTKRTAINNILNANTIPYIANGLGSVSAPSYTFTGDLNTGMWSPGADTIAFSEGGAEAMRITSAGNVGIGTTAPAVKLEVSSAFDVGALNPDPTEVRISTTTISSSYPTDKPWGRLSFYSFDLSDAGPKVQGAIDAISSIANGGRMAMVFSSVESGGALIERMRITDDGNVGIGTTTPAAKLDINGPIINGNITVRGDGSEGGQITFNNAANSAGPLTLDVDATGNGRLITTVNNANLSLGQLSGTGGVVLFYTANSERMRIDSTGSVGIGTSSPDVSALLDVSSTTKGFLPPRMSTAQRDAIGGATQEGLILYNVTTDKLQVFAAGAWVNLH